MTERFATNDELNWQRLVKRLKDMRAYGGRDYACMDDAAEMITQMAGHIESLLSERGRTPESEECFHASVDDRAVIEAARKSPLSAEQVTTPRADAIVDAYLEKCDRVYPDGTSAEDIERDLRNPIRQLERELAAESENATEFYREWMALKNGIPSSARLTGDPCAACNGTGVKPKVITNPPKGWTP